VVVPVVVVVVLAQLVRRWLLLRVDQVVRVRHQPLVTSRLLDQGVVEVPGQQREDPHPVVVVQVSLQGLVLMLQPIRAVVVAVESAPEATVVPGSLSYE